MLANVLKTFGTILDPRSLDSVPEECFGIIYHFCNKITTLDLPEDFCISKFAFDHDANTVKVVFNPSDAEISQFVMIARLSP